MKTIAKAQPVKKVTKVEKTKKVTAKKVQKVSTYKMNVLEVNKALKTSTKSLGGARAILLNFASEIGLNANFVKILKASKEPQNYKLLAEKVRTSKSGNYSPFFILQTLNKHEAYFNEVYFEK